MVGSQVADIMNNGITCINLSTTVRYCYLRLIHTARRKSVINREASYGINYDFHILTQQSRKGFKLQT